MDPDKKEVMALTYTARFREILQESGLARSEEIQGCTRMEIAELESHFGLSLPPVYREFLLQAGRSAGMFYRGSALFYPGLKDLQKFATELLVEAKNDFALPLDAFVFFMHQGYQFMYFRTEGGEFDPPVYNYIEGDTAPKRAYQSFTDFLKESIEEHKQQRL